MHFPDRRVEFEGECRCGRRGRLHHLSEIGGPLCEACFPESMRRRVARDIRTYRMIPKGWKAAVALSGGKDSGSLLHILQMLSRGRMNFRVAALHVNTELGEYSERSQQVCEELAASLGVELVVARIGEWGVRVQQTGRFPTCSVCGGLRRPIMAILTRRLGADVLVTGHTLDDQLVYALKDLLSGKANPPRPVTPQGPVFTQKAKPLFHLPDRAPAIYARLVGIPVVEQACPLFIPDTHRFKDVFEALESLAPMAKKQLIRSLSRGLRRPPLPDRPWRLCPECGEPTYYNPCPLCRLRGWQTGQGMTAGELGPLSD
ncbi:MAG: adenine nucleotide alpha hydrolase family protein [Armatimonadetes bacterium]|nr:adenine nucleotide alpha hydrolase family protein [Armatimonadota bacterium]